MLNLDARLQRVNIRWIPALFVPFVSEGLNYAFVDSDAVSWAVSSLSILLAMGATWRLTEIPHPIAMAQGYMRGFVQPVAGALAGQNAVSFSLPPIEVKPEMIDLPTGKARLDILVPVDLQDIEPRNKGTVGSEAHLETADEVLRRVAADAGYKNAILEPVRLKLGNRTIEYRAYLDRTDASSPKVIDFPSTLSSLLEFQRREERSMQLFKYRRRAALEQFCQNLRDRVPATLDGHVMVLCGGKEIQRSKPKWWRRLLSRFIKPR